MVSFGVDVSKAWVDIARTDNSRTCKQLDKVDNKTGPLTAYFKSQQMKYPNLSVTVESTGMYHLELVRVCLRLGIPLRLVNPVMTKQMTKASVRRIKTDRKDAMRIALLGLSGAGYEVTKEQLSATRFYLRASRKLASTAHILQASRKQYRLAQVPEELLTATFEPCCQALMQASTRLQLEGSMTCQPSLLLLLQSLPGFGPVIAAQVIGEIGSIERFSGAKQVVAYAGLDPSIRRSGTSIHSTGPITKRGSPHLRQALFIAASVARRYDSDLKAVYEHKRSQGKSYRQAVVHIARLLTYRLFVVWKRGTPYEKRT